MLIKDNIDTARPDADHRRLAGAGGRAARARTRSWSQRLRAAGAVILGKTNLSEWANFRSSRSSSGWSGRGGQTRNPYVLDRNPSGSSSGSGVAVAASLCAVAVGTETDGSIVCPAQANGLVGIKPTVGLVSRAGIIPIAASQDTAGPMARTVADAAVLLGALTGVDPRDAGDGRQRRACAHRLHAVPRRRRAARARGSAWRASYFGFDAARGRRCMRGRGRRAEAAGAAEVVDPADAARRTAKTAARRSSRCCCTSSRPT